MTNEALKQSVDQNRGLNPFPQKRVGTLNLQYSVIPPEKVQTIVFKIDDDSGTEIAVKAARMKLTTDELIRRLIWSFNSY